MDGRPEGNKIFQMVNRGASGIVSAWPGSARLSLARLGSARPDWARLGSGLGTTQPKSDLDWLGLVGLGSARLGLLRLGSVRFGLASLRSAFGQTEQDSKIGQSCFQADQELVFPHAAEIS